MCVCSCVLPPGTGLSRALLIIQNLGELSAKSVSVSVRCRIIRRAQADHAWLLLVFVHVRCRTRNARRASMLETLTSPACRAQPVRNDWFYLLKDSFLILSAD